MKLASVLKSLTAAAVVRAMNEHGLPLTTPYVEAAGMMGAPATMDEVTVLDVLRNLGGFRAEKQVTLKMVDVSEPNNPKSYRDHAIIDASKVGATPIDGAEMFDYAVLETPPELICEEVCAEYGMPCVDQGCSGLTGYSCAILLGEGCSLSDPYQVRAHRSSRGSVSMSACTSRSAVAANPCLTRTNLDRIPQGRLRAANSIMGASRERRRSIRGDRCRRCLGRR